MNCQTKPLSFSLQNKPFAYVAISNSPFVRYVATYKKKVETRDSQIELQRHISSLRDKRKAAAFFVVLKRDPDDRTGN